MCIQILKTSWVYREDVSGLSKIIIVQRKIGASTIMSCIRNFIEWPISWTVNLLRFVGIRYHIKKMILTRFLPLWIELQGMR